IRASPTTQMPRRMTRKLPKTINAGEAPKAGRGYLGKAAVIVDRELAAGTDRRSLETALLRPPPPLMAWPAFGLGVPPRTTVHRDHPQVIGWIGGPADAGERLAAVVVGSTAAGEAVPGPPVQQPAAIGIPTARWDHALKEAVLGWLAAARLRG